MNQWEERITRCVRKVLRTEYSHMTQPAAVKGKITKAVPGGYNLVILDEELNRDVSYPELPSVKNSSSYRAGDIVIVMFLYGKMENVHILGKAQ